MIDIVAMVCCGISEIHNLQTVHSDLARKAAIKRISYDSKGAFIFTQAKRLPSSYSYSEEFANYIKKHKLGTVTAVPTFTNPNTLNKIRAFVWVPNEQNIRKFLRK